MPEATDPVDSAAEVKTPPEEEEEEVLRSSIMLSHFFRVEAQLSRSVYGPSVDANLAILNLLPPSASSCSSCD
ncbi:MAG: hypothetical protein GY820_30275 [Gammaproteobacteria bacterium]|nr:hypothetical protein [Gammaproteobacteria bacterium]